MATATAITVPTIGPIDEFNLENESIAAHLERFKLFVSVNGIPASSNPSSRPG